MAGLNDRLWSAAAGIRIDGKWDFSAAHFWTAKRRLPPVTDHRPSARVTFIASSIWAARKCQHRPAGEAGRCRALAQRGGSFASAAL